MNRQALLLSALALILVGALWWLFLYAPGREDLAAVEADIIAAEDEGVALNGQIVRLEQIRATAPETEALIAQLGSIVPIDPALAGALRQIEAAAEDAGVTIDTLASSRPTPADGDAEGLHRIGLNMGLQGSYFQLVDFLRRIEDPTITARGILFRNLALNAAQYPTLTGTLTGEMYAVLDPVPSADAAPAPAPVEEEAEEGGAGDAEPLEEEGGVE